MGLFDIFTNSAQPSQPQPSQLSQQQPQPQQPVQPGNLPDTPPASGITNDGIAPNGTVPEDGTKAADSPLDEFATLWEPVSQDDTSAPQELDPTKLQEVIGKADLTSVVSQESLSAISAGGEEAQKAFAESLNAVAQQTLLQATLASDKITKQAVDNAVAAMEAKIPELVRKQALSANLKEANPLFSNPAVKPVIEAVQSQLAAKNPDATPAQLAEMAQNFVSVMGEALAPKPAQQPNSDSSDVDWSKFLDGGTPGI